LAPRSTAQPRRGAIDFPHDRLDLFMYGDCTVDEPPRERLLPTCARRNRSFARGDWPFTATDNRTKLHRRAMAGEPDRLRDDRR